MSVRLGKKYKAVPVKKNNNSVSLLRPLQIYSAKWRKLQKLYSTRSLPHVPIKIIFMPYESDVGESGEKFQRSNKLLYDINVQRWSYMYIQHVTRLITLTILPAHDNNHYHPDRFCDFMLTVQLNFNKLKQFFSHLTFIPPLYTSPRYISFANTCKMKSRQAIAVRWSYICYKIYLNMWTSYNRGRLAGI